MPVVVVEEDSYVGPEDSPFGMDQRNVVDVVDVHEDVDAESVELTIRPRALPTPKLPSAEIVAHHNL